MKLISINIDEQTLALIDKASLKVSRSRSNFMQLASEKYAKEVLSNE